MNGGSGILGGPLPLAGVISVQGQGRQFKGFSCFCVVPFCLSFVLLVVGGLAGAFTEVHCCPGGGGLLPDGGYLSFLLVYVVAQRPRFRPNKGSPITSPWP